MAGGGGGRINKPKAALCMKNVRKERKLKVKSLKRLSKTGRSADTLADTTKDILRQCRTNPKANVHMSGKKRRSLLKEAKRLAAEKSRMETLEEEPGQKEPDKKEHDSVQMETM